MSPTPPVDLDHFEAVLFDLDGVLTATAKVHAACWKQAFDEFLQRRAAKHNETFRPFGIKTDYDDYVDGKSRENGVRSFLRSRSIELPQGHPGDPPDRETICGLGNRKNELFNQALESKGVEVFESSVTWLRQLRQAGIKTAVVSSSKYCQTIIKIAGIADLFDARVDGNVAEELNLKGKPAPDTYLKAAEMEGVPPRRAVVVNVESEISTYLLREGSQFTIWHYDEKVTLLQRCRAHFETIPKNIFVRKDNAMVRKLWLKKLAGINLEFLGIH